MRVCFKTLIVFFSVGVLSLILVSHYEHGRLKYDIRKVDKYCGVALKIIASGPLLLSDIEIRDSMGNNLMFSSSLNEGKLVIYLPSISCVPCSQKGFLTLDSIFKDKFRDKVVLVSNFESLRNQKIIENEFGVTSFSIVSGNLFSSDIYSENPMAFYSDSSMIAGSFYFDGFSDGIVDGWALYFQAIFNKLENVTPF